MQVQDIPQAYGSAIGHQGAGRLREAEQIYREILALRPEIVEARNNLGVVLFQQGRTEEAVGEYREAVARRPGFAEAWNNLGNALRRSGDHQGAIAAFQNAIAAVPAFATAFNNLGLVYDQVGRPDLAIGAYRRFAELEPGNADAHYNLANALRECSQLDAAIDAYGIALSLRPDFVEARHNLALALKDAGRLNESLGHFARAMEIRPNAFTSGGILCTAHFDPGYGARRIHEMSGEWDRRFAAPLAPRPAIFSNDPDPGRRLKIGYVSPDFREHPVGRFFLPLVSHHDRTGFEVFCYTDVARPDRVTDAIRSHAQVWQPTSGLTDGQMAELVRRDGIDILVDLTMHMKGSRLLAFARKPAPVQVTYLAYVSTTGLSAMDYRLSDPYLDPPGIDESLYSEKTFRLPRTYWCYPRPEDAPPVARDISADPVTFGCLNNFCKVTSVTLEMWRELLAGVPRSRLILHALEGRHRQATVDFFAGAGVEPGRIEFVGQLPFGRYLEQYGRINIALDPFPYGGGTTTCDSLYMGVPVVTLKGETAVSRGGSSILSNVGHGELIAAGKDEYIEIARSLAADADRMTRYRATLRGEMGASAVMDAPGFAHDVEGAFRSMWRDWCESRMASAQVTA